MNILYISYVLLLCNFLKVFTKTIEINNASEFKDIFRDQHSDNDDNDIIINVVNEIELNDSDFIRVGDTISKIAITGVTINSKIIFNSKNSGIFFGKHVNNIEIMDITIESDGSVFYFDNNQQVNLYNVNMTGFVEVNMNSITKNVFTITNSNFNTPNSPINYLLRADSINLQITDSKFNGSQNLLISCLYISNKENGEIYVTNDRDEYGIIDIKNSIFKGGYTSRGIIAYFVSEINIKNSEIKDCYNNVRDGSFNCYFCDKVSVKNTIFLDNYTTEIGGSISLYRARRSFLENLLFVNTTAEGSGSAMYIYSEKIDNSISFIKNNTLKNVYARKNQLSRGHFLGLLGYIDITIEDIYCENINSYITDGSLFFINEDSKISMKNINLSNIYGNGIGALFFNCVNNNNLVVTIDTVVIKDSYQASIRSSSILLWLSSGVHMKLSNVKVINSGGYYVSFLTQFDLTNLEINNLYVDGFNSKIPSAFFDNEVMEKDSVTLKINNANIKNVYSLGAIIYMLGSKVEITNSNFDNIHSCFRNSLKGCEKGQSNIGMRDSSIGNLVGESTLLFENITISNLYGIRGFSNYSKVHSTIKNLTVENSFLENGIFSFSNDNNAYGFFEIDNSLFNNVESVKGSILNILKTNSGNYGIFFRNSKFQNNHSLKYGGIIYSIEESTSKNVNFTNCEFFNNTSSFGHIAYSLNKVSEPLFHFNEGYFILQQYKAIPNTFSTNPTRLAFHDDSYIINEIVSGTLIIQFIIINIYDDYNNQLSFGSSIDELIMDDLAYFEVKVTDKYGNSGNADIVGQSHGYCWEDKCYINNIQIVGFPGEYKFTFELLTFGVYSKFSNNKISMDFKIIECNETENIYQVKEHKFLKSCYKPKCDPSCNSGRCINDNVCDCSSTTYTGLYCNEHYKVARSHAKDILYRIISHILYLISTILIIAVFINRNVSIIKGGGYEFLILILVGMYFNAYYINSLTHERTKTRCFSLYITKNLAFSLIFGSILVKTLRIHIIFKYIRHATVLQAYKMHLIICSFILYHSILVILWMKYDGLSCSVQYNKLNKEYKECVYGKTKVFSILFNYSVLLVGIWLAYSIRYVNENFKEVNLFPLVFFR
ncbi:hypothetical protein BCR36DRAFT_30734 [Piromyces finnis]|uniref:G-protein coupled receptors family 3 profile domain-containing protein n=1 Tax=Piromyces finnis TaxID=1754191 RepID=A0A1Y1VC15_9FUNG|nr:hypothetical protein BCR36DRAFT_30734 [Piromyces finnis]|eukprot:ORX52522.1 hypothetical protein BCR36DRAFT_30734 [Piromyces finnis]